MFQDNKDADAWVEFIKAQYISNKDKAPSVAVNTADQLLREFQIRKPRTYPG